MTSRMVEHFHEVSHCPICREILRKPRLIWCGHTFCLECLTSLNVNGLRPQDQVLECPICKKITKIPKGGVNQFPPNYMAIQVQTAVNEARQMKKRVHCEACPQPTTASVFCRDCQCNFCDDCGSKHQAVGSFANHAIRDLHDVPTTLCQKHSGQMISFFCSICAEAVCPICATSSHTGSDHAVVSLKEASDSFVEHTQQTVENVRNNRKSKQDKLQDLRQQATDNFNVQLTQVEETFKAELMKIQQKESDLKELISDMHAQNMRTLDEFEKGFEADCASLDTALVQTESVLQDIRVSNFIDRRREVLALLGDTSDRQDLEVDSLHICDYSFAPGEDLGEVIVEGNRSNRDLTDVEDPDQTGDSEVEYAGGQETDSVVYRRSNEANANNISDAVEMRNRGAVPPSSVPQAFPRSTEETRQKVYHTRSPMLVGSYTLPSGVSSIPVNVVGVGLLDNNVICAYNINCMGQVVLCSEVNKQQVLYRRRKGIAAFALHGDEECGVVLTDDCNISRLLLNDIGKYMDSDREITCMTQKFSCKASNIGAMAFNEDGVAVISDSDKNCLTGIDRQNRRRFNLNGNRNGNDGSFSATQSLTIGPYGEIILYDKKKRRLAVFNEDTKFRLYIDLPDTSSDCSIACDMDGLVYVADKKHNKVLMVPLDGSEQAVEILNSDHGLSSPSCIAFQGRLLAVANAKSFNESEIRVFEFGNNYSTQL